MSGLHRCFDVLLQFCKLSDEKGKIDVISVVTGLFLGVIVFDRGGK